MQKLENIKKLNKIRLADYIRSANAILVDPESIFDVQVKRLHEYKRQLLNLLHIMHLYLELKENPNRVMQPRTFIFGAKAAAGYYIAKQIISLAYHMSVMINKDPIVRDQIKIVFLENYSVSLSEIIMPSSDVSEQISLAGKEASGTGNMKLMINGAITLGTMDGANVEICQAVGMDNIFIFGLRAEEIEDLKKRGVYDPKQYMQDNSFMSQVIAFMKGGIDGIVFNDIIDALTSNNSRFTDHYFIMADFEAYRQAQSSISDAWQDRTRWNQMSLTNIAKAGIFSADRSVRDYADRIWGIEPLKGK